MFWAGCNCKARGVIAAGRGARRILPSAAPKELTQETEAYGSWVSVLYFNASAVGCTVGAPRPTNSTSSSLATPLV